MKNYLKELLLLISALCQRSRCLETCRSVVLSGAGAVDGNYEALTDYRGRPDFYRADGVYNLFGEESVEGCYWRIDSSASEFPFWRTFDCSYHPVDIETEWLLNVSGLDPETITLEILCKEPEPSRRWKTYLTCSGVSLALVFFTVWGHVVCRRKRISKAKRECVVCRKSASDAAKVVQRAFDRKPSILRESR